MTKRCAPVTVASEWASMTIGGTYDRVVRVPPADVLPPRFLICAPLVKSRAMPRPITVIEAEIRRATVPGLRREDV